MHGHGNITAAGLALGEAGWRFCNAANTDPQTGPFGILDILADTVLTAIEGTNLDGDSIVGTSIPAGTKLYGNFAGYTKSSGVVVAYKLKLTDPGY